MEASGNDSTASGGQVVNPGDTFGLAQANFQVVPSAPLGTVVPVALELVPVFLPPPGGTNLLDPTGAPVPFNIINGEISIGTAAVPEPASLTMLAIAGAGVLAARRFKTARG
jgi:PEP-CTERM motif